MSVYIIANNSIARQRLILNHEAEKLSFELYEFKETRTLKELWLERQTESGAPVQEQSFVEETQSEEILLRQGSLTLPECRAQECWSDMGFWEFIPTDLGQGIIVAVDAYSGLCNQRFLGFGRPPLLNTPLQLCFASIYAQEESFLDMTWLYSVSQNCEIEANVPFSWTERSIFWNLPKLELSLEGPESIAAGGEAELELSCRLDGALNLKPVDVYLTHSNGYLPQTRLSVNGQAKIKVLALGLEEGQQMVVKAGWKYWTNAAHKTLTVL